MKKFNNLILKQKRQEYACSKCSSGSSHYPGFHYHHQMPAKPNQNPLSKQLPECGPESLLDMTSIRDDKDIDMTKLNRSIQELHVGDLVKLSFLVNEKEMPWLSLENKRLVNISQSEAMFVRITDINGNWPNMSYQGRLENIPILIHPLSLQYGSLVLFSSEHILHLEPILVSTYW